MATRKAKTATLTPERAKTEDLATSDETAELSPAGEGNQWYVIHTYSGYENKVKANLEHRIETMDARGLILQVVIPTEDEIEIRFIGARAGEKLHEQLWNDGEAVGPTSHPKIMRAARPPIDGEWLASELDHLERLVAEADTLGVVARLRAMVAEPSRAGSAVLEDTLH